MSIKYGSAGGGGGAVSTTIQLVVYSASALTGTACNRREESRLCFTYNIHHTTYMVMVSTAEV